MRRIHKINEYLNIPKFFNVIKNMLNFISNMYLKFKKTKLGIIHFSHVIRDNFTNVVDSTILTSNAQLSVLFYKFHKKYNKECADFLFEDLNKVHSIEEAGDDNLFGGLLGCFLNNNYYQNILQNWGVKFYANALILKLGYEFQSY